MTTVMTNDVPISYINFDVFFVTLSAISFLFFLKSVLLALKLVLFKEALQT